MRVTVIVISTKVDNGPKVMVELQHSEQFFVHGYATIPGHIFDLIIYQNMIISHT